MHSPTLQQKFNRFMIMGASCALLLCTHTIASGQLKTYKSLSAGLEEAQRIQKPLLVWFRFKESNNQFEYEQRYFLSDTIQRILASNYVVATLFVDDDSKLKCKERKALEAEFPGQEIRTKGQKWKAYQNKHYPSKGHNYMVVKAPDGHDLHVRKIIPIFARDPVAEFREMTKETKLAQYRERQVKDQILAEHLKKGNSDIKSCKQALEEAEQLALAGKLLFPKNLYEAEVGNTMAALLQHSHGIGTRDRSAPIGKSSPCFDAYMLKAIDQKLGIGSLHKVEQEAKALVAKNAGFIPAQFSETDPSALAFLAENITDLDWIQNDQENLHILRFTVTETGELKDITYLQTPIANLSHDNRPSGFWDEEIRRVMALMPPWKAARLANKATSSTVELLLNEE